jgi:hypothetical protein
LVHVFSSKSSHISYFSHLFCEGGVDFDIVDFGSGFLDFGSDRHVDGSDLHMDGSDLHVDGSDLHVDGSDLCDLRDLQDSESSDFESSDFESSDFEYFSEQLDI